ncbi:MAG: hypothetical protein KDB61_16450, partial [Planctomycetes bacterium]|nr:hypothetical protein [Planctomycetota bacterium]
TVSRHDLFVDQLEHYWTEEGRKVQVVNTGTEGYSTDQEVAWLLEHGEKWAPDLVLLFAYENDIYYNGENHYLRFPKPRFTAEGELETARLVDPGTKGFLRSTAIGNLVMEPLRLDTFETPVANRPLIKEFAPLLKDAPEFLADAQARTQGAMKALRKKCDELGAKLAVVVLPSHSAISPDYAELFSNTVLGMARSDWDPNQPVEFLLDAARSAGILALDPRAELSRAH